MKIGKLFLGLDISAMGLSAQRKRMNAIASNIANAETTKTEEGGPYCRKVVTLHAGGQQSFARVLQSSSGDLSLTNEKHIPGSFETTSRESLPGSVEPNEDLDKSPFRNVYDPSHPDADETGYVKMPNVNIVSEMVEMMTASRAYEANVTAASAAKMIAKDALEI